MAEPKIELYSKLDLDVIASYPEHFDTNLGKFVRVGGLIMVGPSNPDEAQFRVLHNSLYRAATDDPNFAEQAATDPELHLPTTTDMLRLSRGQNYTLHDAGNFSYHPWNTLDEEEVADVEEFSPGLVGRDVLQVFGYSESLGQALEVGRRVTGELFQTTIGPETTVETSLW